MSSQKVEQDLQQREWRPASMIIRSRAALAGLAAAVCFYASLSAVTMSAFGNTGVSPGLGRVSGSAEFCTAEPGRPNRALMSRRVLSAPSRDLRQLALEANRTLYRPSQAVIFRLVNRSRVDASYGEEFRFEREAGSGWSRDPASPERYWSRVAHTLPIGSAGFCQAFRLPADQPAGRYRIVKIVHVSLQSGQTKAIHRSALFRVHY